MGLLAISVRLHASNAILQGEPSQWGRIIFILYGTPPYIRSDNGSEFVVKAVHDWITGVGAECAFIEPGSPWENDYRESFNAELRDDLLNGEVFYSLAEARAVVEG